MKLRLTVLLIISVEISYCYAASSSQTVYAPIYTCMIEVPNTVTCRQSTNSYFPTKVVITDLSGIGVGCDPAPFYPYIVAADAHSTKPAKVMFMRQLPYAGFFTTYSVVNLSWGYSSFWGSGGTEYDASCRAPVTPDGYKACDLLLYQ